MPNKTAIDHQIGKAVFAINLICAPTPAVRDSISRLQDRVERGVPRDVVYRCPAKSLHASVFQFVWARGSRNSTQEDLWSGLQDRVIAALDDAVSEAGIINLASPSLDVRQSAMILVFSPSPAVETLRELILGFEVLSALDARRPGIQHVTLFRYSREIPLQPLLVACQTLKVDIPIWSVTQLELVREKIYPYLDIEVIRRFAVADSSGD